MERIYKKRNKTAREIAEHFGVCIATVKRHISERREDFEARARARQKFAYDSYNNGASWDRIASELGTSVNAARQLRKRHINRLKSAGLDYVGNRNIRRQLMLEFDDADASND